MKKIFQKLLDEETTFAVKVVLFIFIILIMMIIVNYLTGNKTFLHTATKEKTVIITAPQKLPPKPPTESITNNVRDALKQVNESTTYMQFKKDDSESSVKLQEKAQELKEVKKETDPIQDPLKFYDETTPREMTVDWVFVYFIDNNGMLTPHFCIQSVTDKPLNINMVKIIADGKNFEIIIPKIKLEKVNDKTAEWYDESVNYKSYPIIQALSKAQNASMVYYGSRGSRKREITKLEIKGLDRIMETYTALGGNFAFIGSEGRAKPLESAHEAP
ncbi:conserved hypothetical protein [Gammaproteobacteria bacterium]